MAGMLAGTAIVSLPPLVRLVMPVAQEALGQHDIRGDSCDTMMLITQAVITTPLILAAAGGLAIKLSARALASIDDCLVTAGLSGLAAVTCVMLFMLLSTIVRPQPLDGALSGTDTVFGSMAGTLTTVEAAAGTLAYSLFSVHGGVAYRAWRSRMRGPA